MVGDLLIGDNKNIFILKSIGIENLGKLVKY